MTIIAPQATPNKTHSSGSVMTAAIAYARAGWRVVPLKPGIKLPRGMEWQKRASADPELVRDHYVNHPDDGVGIATGPASGVWALDVDGDTGRASLDALVAVHGALPRTRRHTTSRGEHLFFTWPAAGLRQTAGTALGAGLDTRAEGGYVVVPPTVRADGGTYTVADDAPIAEAPAWLLTLLMPRSPVGEQHAALTGPGLAYDELPDSDQKRLVQYVARARGRELGRLDALTPPWREGAGWDTTTYEVACNLLDLAESPWAPYTTTDAEADVREHAPRDQAWGATEVEAKIASAHGRSSSGKGRPMPAGGTSPEEWAALDDPNHPLWGGDSDSSGGQTPTPAIPAARQASDPATPPPATTAEPQWQRLQREYPIHGRKRMHRDELFPPTYNAKGERNKNNGPLQAEVCARYINQGFARGADNTLWMYKDGAYRNDEDEVLRRITWTLSDDYTRTRGGAVADILTGLPQSTLPTIPDQRYINVKNGMIKVATGALLPHSPDYRSYVQLDTDYNPDATCPTFDAWLGQVIPADTTDMMWELIGYLMLHGNPLQLAVLLHGGGGNGKGTFLRVIEHIIGRRNISAVPLKAITDGKFETAGMYGKHANICGDIDAAYLRNTAAFKGITGGDTILAQHKGAKPFEFACWAVPVFSANALWASADVSEGYFRRWVVMPFPNKVTGGAFNEGTLLDEAPGILAKAIPALQRLLDRGKFATSDSSERLMRDFQETADTVLSWIDDDEWLTVHDTTAHAKFAERKDLYRRYRAWCTDNGYTPIGSRGFYARLEQLGYTVAKRDGFYVFRGLALTENA